MMLPHLHPEEIMGEGGPIAQEAIRAMQSDARVSFWGVLRRTDAIAVLELALLVSLPVRNAVMWKH